MDDIDRQILEILQESGKIPLRELESFLHVTPATLSRHIMKLEDDDIITGYRASLNLESLGGYHFMVEIVPDLGNYRALRAFIERTPAFIQVFELHSRLCYILECFWMCKQTMDCDLSHLNTFGQISTTMVKSVTKKKINL